MRPKAMQEPPPKAIRELKERRAANILNAAMHPAPNLHHAATHVLPGRKKPAMIRGSTSLTSPAAVLFPHGQINLAASQRKKLQQYW